MYTDLARRLALFFLVLLLLPACNTAQSPGAVTAKPPVTLTVSAASDLALVLPEIAAVFERQTGHKVVFNFGSTGQLAQQISQGAPVDLFAAADAASIDGLEQQGLLLPGGRALYGQGRLALWARADSPLAFTDLRDLLQPSVRKIAIADPGHAPYGLAAHQALESVGLWEQLKPKLVYGTNVQQTLQYAQTGNVDVALVALSLSLQTPGGRWTLVPATLHQPLNQTLAIIKGTHDEAVVRAFAAFINGPEGRPIMKRYGFTLPGEP